MCAGDETLPAAVMIVVAASTPRLVRLDTDDPVHPEGVFKSRVASLGAPQRARGVAVARCAVSDFLDCRCARAPRPRRRRAFASLLQSKSVFYLDPSERGPRLPGGLARTAERVAEQLVHDAAALVWFLHSSTSLRIHANAVIVYRRSGTTTAAWALRSLHVRMTGPLLAELYRDARRPIYQGRRYLLVTIASSFSRATASGSGIPAIVLRIRRGIQTGNCSSQRSAARARPFVIRSTNQPSGRSRILDLADDRRAPSRTCASAHRVVDDKVNM